MQVKHNQRIVLHSANFLFPDNVLLDFGALFISATLVMNIDYTNFSVRFHHLL